MEELEDIYIDITTEDVLEGLQIFMANGGDELLEYMKTSVYYS